MPLLLTCHSRIPQYCFKTKAARITCPLRSLLELRQVEQAQGAEGAQVKVARPQNLTFQIALPIWAWAAIDRPAGHRRACREKGLGSVGSTRRGRPCLGLHSPLTPGLRPWRSGRISQLSRRCARRACTGSARRRAGGVGRTRGGELRSGGAPAVPPSPPQSRAGDARVRLPPSPLAFKAAAPRGRRAGAAGRGPPALCRELARVRRPPSPDSSQALQLRWGRGWGRSAER